jgi:hypothetical protein
LLIVIQPAAALAGGFAAFASERRWILHATFLATVLLVPSATLLLAWLAES